MREGNNSLTYPKVKFHNWCLKFFYQTYLLQLIYGLWEHVCLCKQLKRKTFFNVTISVNKMRKLHNLHFFLNLHNPQLTFNVVEFRVVIEGDIWIMSTCLCVQIQNNWKQHSSLSLRYSRNKVGQDMLISFDFMLYSESLYFLTPYDKYIYRDIILNTFFAKQDDCRVE